MNTHKALLVVITAPSGAGKTTLCTRLLESDSRLSRVITCTTRRPRSGEVDGEHYRFLTHDEFATRVAEGKFLEHADVYGNQYGTQIADVVSRLGNGHDALLSVDVQGSRTIRSSSFATPLLTASVVTLFLMPPSLGSLEDRLKSRQQDAKESIEHRLRTVTKEIPYAADCDYVVPARDVNETFQLARSILSAERLKPHRLPTVWDAAAWRLIS